MKESCEMPRQLQTPFKISREFLSGDWQYLLRNVRAIRTASLFCFCPFVFTRYEESVGPSVEKKMLGTARLIF